MNYIKFLTKTTVMLWLLAAAILIMIVISLIARQYQLAFLDEIVSPEKARALIASLTEAQRMAHVFITATLDAIFPIVYGGLFVGAALRFFSVTGKYLAFLVFIAVPCDLIEGVVQVLALTGVADVLELKLIITPIKIVMFLLGWVVLIIGTAKALYLKIAIKKA